MKHPAPYTPGLIPIFAEVLEGAHSVLDPFAGTGRIHNLRDYGYDTTGVELEREWANMAEGTIIGDSTKLTSIFPADQYFDAICTSPCYGNRFADAHEARDGSTRRSYTHDIGRKLSPNNAGAMQWGPKYRTLHSKVWEQCLQMLLPGGLFALNIKDHIRKLQRQYVAGWHVSELSRIGFTLQYHIPFVTSGMRHGENYDARVPEEMIYVFKKD